MNTGWANSFQMRESRTEVAKGLVFEAEAKAGSITGRTEGAGGVVDEATGMESADESATKIGAAGERVEKGAPSWCREAEGHGVDSEVATG